METEAELQCVTEHRLGTIWPEKRYNLSQSVNNAVPMPSELQLSKNEYLKISPAFFPLTSTNDSHHY